MNLKEELTSLLNKYSMENGSNTPDFILANHMLDSLLLFEHTTKARDRWYGVDLRPRWRGNAVQEQVSDEIHVRKTPGDSETLGE